MHKNKKTLTAILLVIIATPAFFGFTNYTGYPSDVISFFSEWKITLGTGSSVSNLVDYEHEDYFYNVNDSIDWVVYKTPNSGGTTTNSSNTRSELRQYSEWTPEKGGKLTGTLKVMQVSTTGDARVPATFSVVVGQIHSSEGHENEPIKIFYKKFPGHTKGSVFWNYEINTEGDNGERWDYSYAVWGNDWSVVGATDSTYPEEPTEGIALGEVFSYEINVHQGIMYVTFESEGHATKTFTKSLTSSEYTNYSDIPQQVLTIFSTTGQDGTEEVNAYADELQYFKQGAYNQTNGKTPADNMIWNTGAETYGGDLDQQYASGSYAEVWFQEATVGASSEPTNTRIREDITKDQITVHPNPTTNILHITSSNKALTSVEIIDMMGQSVINKTEVDHTNTNLNLSELTSGNYLLVSRDALNHRTISPIIKQ